MPAETRAHRAWDGAHPSCLPAAAVPESDRDGKGRAGRAAVLMWEVRAPHSDSGLLLASHGPGSVLSFFESLVLVLMMCTRNHCCGRGGPQERKWY